MIIFLILLFWYLLIGYVWSVFKWKTICQSCLEENKAHLLLNKALIITIILIWPFSVLRFLLRFILRKLFFKVESFWDVYDRVSKEVYRTTEKEI